MGADAGATGSSGAATTDWPSAPCKTITGDAEQLTAEVAWVIATDHQNNGYAREAAQAMIGWLVERGADRVIAHIHPEHRASDQNQRPPISRYCAGVENFLQPSSTNRPTS
jgi:hypothetical protein